MKDLTRAEMKAILFAFFRNASDADFDREKELEYEYEPLLTNVAFCLKTKRSSVVNALFCNRFFSNKRGDERALECVKKYLDEKLGKEPEPPKVEYKWVHKTLF